MTILNKEPNATSNLLNRIISRLMINIFHKIKAILKNLLLEEKYPDVRNSSINAMRLNGVTMESENDSNSKTYYINNWIAEIEKNEIKKSGLIAFASENINLNKSSIKNCLDHLLNANNNGAKRSSCSYKLGKFISGKYKSDYEKWFTEESFSIEISGINSERLLEIAETLCLEFKQELVLVKDYKRDKIYLVKQSKIA